MADSMSNSSSGGPKEQFATTLWTAVVQAGSGDAKDSRAALERLCQIYWYPIYAHIRRRGYSRPDAQDLAQGFFAHLLERAPFQNLSPSKGRFRSFLLTVLGHYLADERDRLQAAKRGGGEKLISLDDSAAEWRYATEKSAETTPEKEFDRRWARTVLERGLEALRLEQAAAGKERLFDAVRVFLVDVAGRQDYPAIAAELNMAANTLAVTVRRLRQRYRELIRAEIAQTLAHPADVEAEMRHLLEAMRG